MIRYEFNWDDVGIAFVCLLFVFCTWMVFDIWGVSVVALLLTYAYLLREKAKRIKKLKETAEEIAKRVMYSRVHNVDIEAVKRLGDVQGKEK